MNCSPLALKQCKKCRSCFDKSSLLKIAQAYNRTADKQFKIKTSNRTKEQLWNDIRNRLYGRCKDDERCWLKQGLDNSNKLSQLDKERFRPKMPDEWKKNKYTWLSNFDIEKVMDQYELVNNDYIFFGPVPVDCPNGIMCELTNMNPIKLKRDNIRKIGIIFNLDKHNQPGSHWVALYIDMTKPIHIIDYFDSYAGNPPELIRKFILKLHNIFITNNIRSVMIYNDKRHQYGHSECGIYSIFYILNRIDGKTPYDMSKKLITDSRMNELRKLYFSI
tara:strand:+ start:1278 stop:2105 length:828 start_codon:yes stop_codon:yes gene_type:complete